MDTLERILKFMEAPEPAPPTDSALFNFFLMPEPPKPPAPEPVEPCALKFQESTCFWAMQNMPATEATKHLLILGVVGSGKTTAIKLYLKSIAPRFRAGREKPEQLIVYDAKRDMIPILAKLGLRPEDENVWILNPFDARGASWDMAATIRTPAMARYLASLLIPEEKNSSAPFFYRAARRVVYAVILGLNKVKPGNWTFRDLLCALDSKEHVVAVSSRHPRGKAIARGFSEDESHFPAIWSTIAAGVENFDEVVALWKTNPNGRKFSITEFLKKPGVLILGTDPVFKESLWPINALILRALADEILSGPETLSPRHWFVLDEFRAMEKVDCIHDLLNRGRSKGASVLIGLQSVDGLVDVYGDRPAEDILGQCANKTFLRTGNPMTADWIERFFNKVRRTEVSYSESWGKEYTFSYQYQLQDRPLFLGAKFLDLPLPVVGGQYEAIHDLPFTGAATITKYFFDEVLSWLEKPTDSREDLPDAAAVELRANARDQELAPWDPNEETDFCTGIKQQEETQGDLPLKPSAGRKRKLPERSRKDRRDMTQ